MTLFKYRKVQSNSEAHAAPLNTYWVFEYSSHDGQMQRK